MKKTIFLLLLCAGICAAAYGEQTLKTYDGTVWKKGDVITLGYHSVTARHYITIKNKIINEYGREQYPNIKEDLSYRKFTIVDFITPQSAAVFANKNPIAVVIDDQNREFYIDMDQAVERGEVISVLPETIDKNAVYLTDDLLMACLIRVNSIPVNDHVLLRFIGTRDKELQNLCRKDEFELHKAKPVYMELLQKLMDEFDFSATYYVKSNLAMDKYDFSVQAYPLNQSFLKNDEFFSYGDYNFMIGKGWENYRLLPVPLEKAETANKRRKGAKTNGYISALVYGKVYLKLLDQRMELPQSAIINMENAYRHTVIGARITGIEVYDYPHCEYNFIGSIQ